MIVLFTDFGAAGPYVGQMKAVLAREAPAATIIDLVHDTPAFRPQGAAYLLAALAPAFPADAVFLCVVDPGVGGSRAALVIEADGRRFVGPDNGLFEIVLRRAANTKAWTKAWEITWRPDPLSASFHGRDLFAPVAARLARGEAAPGDDYPVDRARRPDWPDDLAEVIYIDHFGNAMTGLRAANLAADAIIETKGEKMGPARTFAEVPEGAVFWYENANGLVEIAVNRGRADTRLGIAPGDPVDPGTVAITS